MHGLLSWSDPKIQGLLLVQVVGFPLAFLTRAIRWGILSYRETAPQRRIGQLKAGGNLCFALTSIAFVWSIPLGVLLFAIGINLAYIAFRMGRASRPSAVEAAPAATSNASARPTRKMKRSAAMPRSKRKLRLRAAAH
ncbi:MAG TPA: hypothetical protein VFJ58_25340 [Armatimonadota bacterium]|nr:hypothetical protein [Armatimonadota bacterium]